MEIGETSAINRSLWKKIKNSEDEQVDRLSNLPDSILIHILSFLPIEDAVNTMLLRRFGHLWTSLQTLEFDGRSYDEFKDSDYHKWLRFKDGYYHKLLRLSRLEDDHYHKWLRFFNFVRYVLLLHDCPTIFKFSLKFGSYLYFSPNDVDPNRLKRPLQTLPADDVCSWINFAVKKKVRVLDLGILAHDSSSTRFDFVLPDSVLTCNSLIELKLVNVGLPEQLQVQMRLLKTLSLTTIVLSDMIIEKILAGCPLLETLSIIKCCGMRKLNCTSKNLKHLMIVLGAYGQGQVEIWGPHLSSVHIAGMGLTRYVVLKNLPCLVEATLDISFGGDCPIGRYNKVGELLEKLHHASTFKISNWCILVLSLWEVTGVSCPSSPRKLMTVETPLTKWHLPGIASLLKSSPSLETVIIHVEPESSLINTNGEDLRIGICGPRQENYWNNKRWLNTYDFSEKNYWHSKQPFDCLLNHLKTVKISGSVSNPHVLPLIRFLLVHSRVLENMVIYTGQSIHNQPHHLLGFSQKVLSFPRASDHVGITLC